MTNEVFEKAKVIENHIRCAKSKLIFIQQQTPQDYCCEVCGAAFKDEEDFEPEIRSAAIAMYHLGLAAAQSAVIRLEKEFSELK